MDKSPAKPFTLIAGKYIYLSLLSSTVSKSIITKQSIIAIIALNVRRRER